MALARDEGTVDDCHPNDLGFVSMSQAVGDLLEKNNIDYLFLIRTRLKAPLFNRKAK